KRIADRNIKGWSDIKRAAHSFNITETTHLQMQTLEALTAEAAAIMKTLKQPDDDNAVQGVLLPLEDMEPVAGKVVLTPNGQEPEQEVNSNELSDFVSVSSVNVNQQEDEDVGDMERSPRSDP